MATPEPDSAPISRPRLLAIIFGAAAVVGLYLAWWAGWPLLAVGVASIAFGLLYTAGPKPLGYLGLGDALVFVFFGPVAVAGTYYVQALTLTPTALAAGIPIGALATAILVVNNLRDIPTDSVAGKRTLAVRIGPAATKSEYVLLLALAFASVVLLAGAGNGLDAALLLPWLAAPEAAILARRVLIEGRGTRHNLHLVRTARLLAVFGILLAFGWAL